MTKKNNEENTDFWKIPPIFQNGGRICCVFYSQGRIQGGVDKSESPSPEIFSDL